MANNTDEPSIKGARVRIADTKRSNLGASLDSSKASPSNGQCPTAVSSRNQTIPSRELQNHTQKPGSGHNDLLQPTLKQLGGGTFNI